MKKRLHTILTLLLLTQLAVSQSSEKILVSSLNPEGQTSLLLNMDGPVEIEYWKGDFIKIQSTVSIENATDAVLKSLVSAGRYRIFGTIEQEKFIIHSPNLKKEVALRGVPLEEKVTYLLSVPEGFTVEYVKDGAISAVQLSDIE